MHLAGSCLAVTALALALAAVPARAQDTAPDPWVCFPDGVPESASALRFTIDACRDLLRGHTPPADLDAWEARAPRVRQALLKGLGLDPLPPRTPLNARIVGTTPCDGYRVENLVFESRPGFLVTANVFIPEGVPLPAPGIVVVPGHAMDDGKNYELYLTAQLGLMRLGCVVLGFDPIGQGARKVPGFDHMRGYGSLLVGQTNEGYILWDAMRAFDYLETRHEVDPARLGIAGNSGGGEATFYAMPIDERIQAGTSFCFTCSYDAWVSEGGNHCICNHMPGLIDQMEQSDILGLIAPRAFLAGNGTEDPIFPIAGTRETIAQARGLYAMLGAPEAVTSVEADQGHGWSQVLREASYGWMDRWLLGRGDGSPIPEPEMTLPEGDALLCYDGAGIPRDSETVVTLNRARAEELRAGHVGPEALPEALWKCFGGRPAEYAPEARELGSFDWEGMRVTRLALTTEPGMEVAALLLRREGASEAGPATVYLGAADKAELREDAEARAARGGRHGAGAGPARHGRDGGGLQGKPPREQRGASGAFGVRAARLGRDAGGIVAGAARRRGPGAGDGLRPRGRRAAGGLRGGPRRAAGEGPSGPHARALHVLLRERPAPAHLAVRAGHPGGDGHPRRGRAAGRTPAAE